VRGLGDVRQRGDVRDEGRRRLRPHLPVQQRPHQWVIAGYSNGGGAPSNTPPSTPRSGATCWRSAVRSSRIGASRRDDRRCLRRLARGVRRGSARRHPRLGLLLLPRRMGTVHGWRKRPGVHRSGPTRRRRRVLGRLAGRQLRGPRRRSRGRRFGGRARRRLRPTVSPLGLCTLIARTA
jgi:hypothetical protein